MIKKAYLIYVGITDPYRNLALEEFLFDRLCDNEAVMFLWQNDNTIVIGQNQNAFSQCDIRAAEELGTKISRRRSGGGAVYHDMGNLNYTFITPDSAEFAERDRSVVLEALRDNGIDASPTGRNDIESGGRKISGTAWYSDGGKLCHHGTLLISSDIAVMSKVLLVDSSKWADKGVDSVRSRVITLRDINGSVSIDSVRGSLEKAFREEYRGAEFVVRNDIDDIVSADPELYGRLVRKYSSEQWIYGREIKADLTVKKKFPWGLAEIQCKIQGDIIADIRIFSDSMDAELIKDITAALGEARFCGSDITERTAKLSERYSGERASVTDDIAGMLLGECPQNM